MHGISLADMLGLRPLDRVQINNQKEIGEFMFFARRGENFDLPFFYFQRVLDNGMFEVRSPGGYSTSIDPLDICDVVRGEAVTVRAMPRAVFMERQRLSLAERQKAPPADCFAEAYVLYATKGKWNCVEPFVWFKDESLNTDKAIHGIINDEDRAMLVAKAKRTIMPVQNYRSSANYSADKGVDAAKDYAGSVVCKFFSASLAGDHHAVEILASIGDKRLSRSSINQIGKTELHK